MGNETFLCKVEFSKYFDLIILQLSKNYLKISSSIKMCDLQWFWFPILRDDQNGYIVETNPNVRLPLSSFANQANPYSHSGAQEQKRQD